MQDLFHDRDNAAIGPQLSRLGGDAGPIQAGRQGMLAERDLDPVAAVKNDLFLCRRQFLPGDFDRKTMGPANLVKDIDGHLRIDDIAVGRAQAEGALPQRTVLVGDQSLDVDLMDLPQPPAMRAAAQGVIEGQMRAGDPFRAGVV